MNRAPFDNEQQRARFAALARVSAGHFDMSVRREMWEVGDRKDRGGWVEVIHDKDGCTSFLWTTARDTHWPFGSHGPALSLTITPEGELDTLMASKHSMHIVWDRRAAIGKTASGEQRQRAFEFADWLYERMVAKQYLQPHQDAEQQDQQAPSEPRPRQRA